MYRIVHIGTLSVAKLTREFYLGDMMRLSFDRKLSVAILVFAALLLMFFNFSQWYLYLQMKRFLEERVSQDIRSLAVSTAVSVDPFTVKDIEAGDYLLTDYVNLANTLDDIRRANELLALDLYDTEGINVLTVDSSEVSSEILNLTEFTSATAGIVASTPIYRSDSLYLLSAYVPVYDFSDTVIAVLHAEAGYAVFSKIGDFRRNIVLMNVGSLLFMLLFVLLFYFVNRRLLTAHQALLRASAISSMGEMAATIAHEIRNPLGIIKNSAERIRKKYAVDSDDQVFGFISDEVDRLNSVVAGYLDFAHPAEGNREPCDLGELVRTLIDQTRTDFSEAGIRVAIEVEDGLPEIEADGFAIRQALLNLMLNAKDAQPDGGSLEMTLKRDRVRGSNGVRIELADSGHGIPRDSLERVFDPFFTTRGKGSGLGLYIVKSVVDSHRGNVKLNSDSDGTVVSLFLPMDR